MFPRDWRQEILENAESVDLDRWAKLAFNDLDQAKDSPSDATITELEAISRQASSMYFNACARLLCHY